MFEYCHDEGLEDGENVGVNYSFYILMALFRGLF